VGPGKTVLFSEFWEGGLVGYYPDAKGWGVGKVDVPVKICGDPCTKKSFHGMMATPDEVMTMRLMLGILSADFKIPVVPLTAG